MSKEIQLDEDELVAWQRSHQTTQIWRRLISLYNPYQGIRNCEPHKVEYYRCMADMMEELERIFVFKEK
jgi:hypothetical protein